MGSDCVGSVEHALRALGELSEVMKPKRFLIMTYLYVMGPTTMATLRRALGMGWGELSTHVEYLKSLGYVNARKAITLAGPRTVVALTDSGRAAYEELVRRLRSVISAVDGGCGGNA